MSKIPRKNSFSVSFFHFLNPPPKLKIPKMFFCRSQKKKFAFTFELRFRTLYHENTLSTVFGFANRNWTYHGPFAKEWHAAGPQTNHNSSGARIASGLKVRF